MDHHEQHHQHHEKDREEKERHHKALEHEHGKKYFKFHPSWWILIGIVLVVIAVLVWSFVVLPLFA